MALGRKDDIRSPRDMQAGPSREEFEERIEECIRYRGLDEIEGEYYQETMRKMFWNICKVRDRLQTRNMGKEDIGFSLVMQQDILIEQNFMIMKMLNEMRKKD